MLFQICEFRMYSPREAIGWDYIGVCGREATKSQAAENATADTPAAMTGGEVSD